MINFARRSKYSLNTNVTTYSGVNEDIFVNIYFFINVVNDVCSLNNLHGLE